MVVQILTIAENSNAELKKKLTAKEQAWKSADLALEGAKRQAESQRKLARKANDQLAASKEQLATLKEQLEETQRLRDQVEKAKVEAEKAKAKAKREKDEAEQHGYDVGVAETEDVLRAEVPAVYRAYCSQTWEEALNRAGIDASSELRRPENILFPPALQVPNQKEAAPPITQPAEDAQFQNPPPPSQQEQAKEPKIQQSTSSNKVAEALQLEAVSQNFENELASTTLPMGEASKEKDKEVSPEVTDKAPKAKLQIKLKPQFLSFLQDSES